MSEKVVFITGANGGLGTFITNGFLGLGVKVVGASLHIRSDEFAGANFEALAVNFTNPAEVRGAVVSTIAKYGRLDAVVHVLGGFAGGDSVAATPDATWEQMRDLNLTSAFYLLRETIPHLRRSGQGRFIAIGSLAANDPHAGLGAYVVFKSALAMLVRTVALENADAGVTANVVLPGTMDTPGNRKSMPNADFSKWVNPKDVADVVLWLADERAAHVTGTLIPVDTGRG